MTVRTAFGVSRLAAAALCLVALVSRFVWGLGSATFNAGNFFAYLTIQSNLAFVAVSVLAGVSAFTRAIDPPWLATMRAAVLSCTVCAGVVFGFLIQQAGERSFRIDVPWSDQVIHFWLPAVAIIDWVVAPGRNKAMWKAVAFALVYPMVWGGFTLVRGVVVGWYPYFFLDPQQVSSFAEFLLFSGLALTLFGVVSTGLVLVSRMPPLARTTRYRVRTARGLRAQRR